MKFIELLTSKGTVTPLVLVIVGSWVTYSILTVLYNLSRFHPLSRIPGPLLARATILPEVCRKYSVLSLLILACRTYVSFIVHRDAFMKGFISGVLDDS